jgi:4-amino-4-deoxy-L-arabinose transferase-like glycosyltransferase
MSAEAGAAGMGRIVPAPGGVKAPPAKTGEEKTWVAGRGSWRMMLTDRYGRIAIILWLVLLLQAVAFALLQPVWSRVDEAQHFHYVQYLYEQRALPVEGETFISSEVVSVSQSADQWGWRQAGSISAPTELDPSQWITVPEELSQPQRERWVRRNLWHFNYEAMQPPLYYAINVPLYAALPGGPVVKLYGMRLLAVLLASLMVPIAFLTAREAFPDSRLVLFGTPAVVLLVQGYALNMSQITNDALATPLAAAAILVMLRIARRGFSWRWTLVAGVLIGAAMLSKLTAIFLLPVALAALVLPVIYRNARWRQALAHAALMALPVALILGPWMIRNLNLYGDVSGASAAAPLMSSFFASPLRDMGTLRMGELLPTFWFGEPIYPFPLWRIAWLPALAAIIVALAGMGYFFAYRFRYHVPVVKAGIVFLSAAFLIGLAVNLLLPFASGIGGVPGRYLYPLLPAGAFLLTFGLDRLIRRDRARFLAEIFLVWMVFWEAINFVTYIKIR